MRPPQLCTQDKKHTHTHTHRRRSQAAKNSGWLQRLKGDRDPSSEGVTKHKNVPFHTSVSPGWHQSCLGSRATEGQGRCFWNQLTETKWLHSCAIPPAACRAWLCERKSKQYKFPAFNAFHVIPNAINETMSCRQKP